MTSYISEAMRQQVKQRADNKCEYCLVVDSMSVKRHEVDHIYAQKHGTSTVLSNLCFSCYFCNRRKGSDLCSIDPITGTVASLFHPRNDRWEDHFSISTALVNGKTPTGRVTIELLQINAPDRVAERQILVRLGQYP